MADEPPPGQASPTEVGRQLEKTAADLRTLAEQLGAIAPGPAKPISQRRATITFVAVVGLAALAAWFIWDHWHSILAATAPLIWIFAHGWRHTRKARRDDSNA
jgi:hypothetical protein